MTNNDKSLLIYSKEILLSNVIVDEGAVDKVKETAKRVEDKSREHLGDKTTDAIKDAAKKVSTSAAQSVRDALIQAAADKSGDAVIKAGKWALHKVIGKRSK